MHSFSDEIVTKDLPGQYNESRAEDFLQEWNAALREDGHGLAGDETIEALLRSLTANSPFLGRCALRRPARMADLLAQSPDAALSDIFDRLEEALRERHDRDTLMKQLRLSREEIAFLTASADIAGLWDFDAVTDALSRFAEAAVAAAVDFLIRQRMIKGDLAMPDGVEDEESLWQQENIAQQAGYFILAMGKLGARELNYSSDIDLITFYEPERTDYTGKSDPQDCFIRLTRDLAKILQERTADGYVLRVDLRLRPDAGATPVCISTDAAEIYYQSVGLNWERAAMIKARPIAGDFQAAHDFFDRIHAFVWRRHLDFAAIEDIHAIKKQIHSHHRHRGIGVAGHDIKLGHGGIREIEFFAQTQQLIAGGRDPRLRPPRTLDALAALAETGWCDDDARDELTAAYLFLRRLEHRLQMIRDEQTHVLPAEEDELRRLSLFMGYERREDFDKDLLAHLRRVDARYDALFEDGPDGEESAEGDVSEPGEITADELSELGFGEPGKVREIVNGWALGRYRACRSERARKILDKIAPALLRAFADTAGPDAALLRFDDFLRQLPSGVQLFSLFQANPWLLEVLAEIMGTAPRLAETLARNVLLLDAVLSPDFFTPLPQADELGTSLEETLVPARDYQDILDLCRRWNNERRFQVGVQLMRRVIDAERAGRDLANIADATLRALWPRVHDEYAERYGRIPGSAMAIIALGKYGGCELTFTSDLDLIFVYDAEDATVESDGDVAAGLTKYYAGLSQRFISALTSLTGEGSLYEVDMRLRPSGTAGPIAVGFDSFQDYQTGSAWTWEHMALTRARVIEAPDDLAARIEEVLRRILTKDRDPDALLENIHEMRERLRREFGTDDPWRIKHAGGGLVDLEFLAQYFELRYAGGNPGILAAKTADVFQNLADQDLMETDTATALIEALDLQTAVQSLLRLCVGDDFDAERAPPGLKKFLAVATDREDFDSLQADLESAQRTAHHYFRTLLADPAEANIGNEAEKEEEK